MPRYSLEPSSYPAILFEILRQEPPREAFLSFEGKKQAKNLQYKFWGLRAAMSKLSEQGDHRFARELYRAERMECSLDELQDGTVRLSFTPKELMNDGLSFKLSFGREVRQGLAPSLGEAELQTRAEQGLDALFADGKRVINQGREPSHESDLPSSLAELMKIEGEKADET